MQKTLTSSLGFKLGLAFALLLLLGLGSTAVSLNGMRGIHENNVSIANDWMEGMTQAANLRHYGHVLRRTQLSLSEASTPEDVNRVEREMADLQGKLAQAIAAYSPLVNEPKEKDLFDAVERGVKNFAEGSTTLVSFMRANPGMTPQQSDEAAMKRLYPVMKGGEDAIANLMAYCVQGAEDATASANASYKALLKTTMIGAVLALVCGIALTIIMTSNIRNPLSQLANVVKLIGEGNLSMRIHHTRQDEIGDLQLYLKTMLRSLNSLMGNIQQGAQHVSDVSREIAQANRDLGSRTESCAASLNRTASSMARLTETIAQSASAAADANSTAASAGAVAAQGGQVVSEVVGNMQHISTQSKKIADIIGVIDGIAFQTNILALNAAVEAARAGDQGRGFAVVASEVRSLSQRSASAAKEVKTLIDASGRSVDSGVNLVKAAGQNMSEIVASVQQVAQMIADVSVSSARQSDDLQSISEAIVKMDELTQQNAAVVEETYAASEGLQQQALELLEAVETFQLTDVPASSQYPLLSR